MSFLWLATTAAAWLLAAYLATHRSGDPGVFSCYSPGYAAVLGLLFLVAVIPMVVVFFRWSAGGSDMLLADVRQASAPAPVLDSAAWFAGVDPRVLMNSRVDSYPNSRGNGILARGIADFLVSNGLAGAGPGP